MRQIIRDNPTCTNVVLLILLVLALGGYWLLPIRGQVLIVTDPARQLQNAWPQAWIEPPAARPGDQVTLYVRDNTPWAHIKLVVDGVGVPHDPAYPAGHGPWVWRWQVTLPPMTPGTTGRLPTAVFYHDCHTGCIERIRITIGAFTVSPAPTPTPVPIPTKLGAVFADPQRDWHGRAAWTVELTYANTPDDVNFSIDGLAQRVYHASRQGLRILVRVAYDRQQALPPVNDEVALALYLDYCARLARDDRLREVYAYIIGSGFNSLDENVQAPDRPTTPEWYARVFNGYGLAAERTDNVVQRMRTEQPGVRVLVGPVTPWISDQTGDIRDPQDVPWLNYFNSLLAALDAAVVVHSRTGRPLTAPDGFALQAPGRPMAAADPSREPMSDLQRVEWNAAQAGFRVYQDWLERINRYASTQGRPAYIISTNTWTPDIPTAPAQNYPAGWLTSALEVINREPQIQALCWFLDWPPEERWNAFSLSQPVGRMHEAASEFDQLLQR